MTKLRKGGNVSCNGVSEIQLRARRDGFSGQLLRTAQCRRFAWDRERRASPAIKPIGCGRWALGAGRRTPDAGRESQQRDDRRGIFWSRAITKYRTLNSRCLSDCVHERRAYNAKGTRDTKVRGVIPGRQ